MPPFKDEQVLIIAPGSAITQCQLGLPETFTPPRWRFPTRMFPGTQEGTWEPIFVKEKSQIKSDVQKDEHHGISGADKDVEMGETQTEPQTEVNGEVKPDTEPAEQPGQVPDVAVEGESDYFDDPFALSHAVYPIQSGEIVDWSCLFGLLSHIYRMISPPFHMPVMVVAQPCWSLRDKETITQYIFEHWKVPALCLIDSALAACWGYGVPSACVIDVGKDKCDVSVVHEYVVYDAGRAVAIANCGGNALTERLQEEFEKKDTFQAVDDLFEFADQVKRSPACEILVGGMPLPGTTVANEETRANPLVAASTGMDGKTNPTTTNGTATNGDSTQEEEDNEGVLDVAAIVAQNNAAELVAKREKEKAEREAKKKGHAGEAPKQTRMRNSEKETTTFTFEDCPSTTDSQPLASRKRKRDFELGLERFCCVTAGAKRADSVLERISDAVYSTIMSVPDTATRSTMWDNLIVVGNGARVRGFTPALLETMQSRYILSPSNATIFTSELPSNFSTPLPTGGTNTPIPGQHPHHSSGVNPLLVAATKNMMQPAGSAHLQVPGQSQLMAAQHQLHGVMMGGPVQNADGSGGSAPIQNYRGISQTPTGMKLVKQPDYFPEFKNPSAAGFEEATFLGAQVAAKVIFLNDGGVSKGFLTRSEYNELGPEGIHNCAL